MLGHYRTKKTHKQTDKQKHKTNKQTNEITLAQGDLETQGFKNMYSSPREN